MVCALPVFDWCCKEGKYTLNPPQDMRRAYVPEDSIIVISESDDEYEYE